MNNSIHGEWDKRLVKQKPHLAILWVPVKGNNDGHSFLRQWVLMIQWIHAQSGSILGRYEWSLLCQGSVLSVLWWVSWPTWSLLAIVAIFVVGSRFLSQCCQKDEHVPVEGLVGEAR